MLKNKVLFYVINTWYQSKCKNKKDIIRIVNETIKDNPNEKRVSKLGMKAKRRCMNEL